MTHPRERFKVLLDVRADFAPAAVTLKRFLKMALRAFGIKCVAVEAVRDDAPPPDAEAIAAPETNPATETKQ